MIKTYECTQCGSTEFEESDSNHIRCSFCHSLFKISEDRPRLRINRGAHVIFGEHSNVEIRGNMEIDTGAEVDIHGKIAFTQGEDLKKSTIKLTRRKNAPQ